MSGFSTRDVAKTLGLSEAQVRAYVRAGFLSPERAKRGAFRFSFQDLVLLRTARGLMEARIPPRRIRTALRKLRAQLPEDRPLTGVHIGADGHRIVVSADGARWHPDDGQTAFVFDFEVEELARKVAPLVRRAAQGSLRAAAQARAEEHKLSADEWYDLGCELEPSAPDQAREAYLRVVELDPHHADAHVNLGRLLQEAGQPGAAEAHYRLALSARPEHPVAAFNLAVALEDLGRLQEAVAAYRAALELSPSNADAHFNLGRLYERLGDLRGAVRHLNAYRRLTRGK